MRYKLDSMLPLNAFIGIACVLGILPIRLYGGDGGDGGGGGDGGDAGGGDAGDSGDSGDSGDGDDGDGDGDGGGGGDGGGADGVAPTPAPAPPPWVLQPIPLVNPGTNPGLVEPASIGQNAPGVNNYNWGQQTAAPEAQAAYDQNQTGQYSAPAQPVMPAIPQYSHANPIGTYNGTGLITPQDLGYPSQQSMQAAFGPGGYNPQPILNSDMYSGLTSINTAPPPIAGNPGTFGLVTPQQAALGHGAAQQAGAALGYVAPAQQLTTITPDQLFNGQMVTAVAPS